MAGAVVYALLLGLAITGFIYFVRFLLVRFIPQLRVLRNLREAGETFELRVSHGSGFHPKVYDVLDGSELTQPVEIPIIGPAGTFFAFVNEHNAVRYHRLRASGFPDLGVRPSPSNKCYQVRRSLREQMTFVSTAEWFQWWWGEQTEYPAERFQSLELDPTLEHSLEVIASHLISDHPNWGQPLASVNGFSVHMNGARELGHRNNKINEPPVRAQSTSD